MSIVSLQTTASGYQGQAVTLYGSLNTVIGALLIAEDSQSGQPRREKYVHASNIQMNGVDLHFKDEHLRDAILAWRDFEASKMMRIEEAVRRHSANARYQVSKITEAGPMYELDQAISSGQVAALMMAWLAKKQMGFAVQSDFGKRIASKLYRVEII